ncbi:MerR family transcriptional regulator [Candidatus Pelagibacter sp.]|nr:MerR family transcriptional regulator [Candidatus Pelagibacter sp.]
MTEKTEKAYKTIGEVAKILNLKSKKEGIFSTHTIRFWETQFKQIKPKQLNSNRRYYDQKTIDILKKIKFLLKDQGMTINGVKKILNNQGNNETLNLDEISNNSIRTDNFKNKVLKISKIVKNLKNYK